jgi:hypothetical protein
MEQLNHYLRALRIDCWRASFCAIEQIIGSGLPESSRKYPAWWSNDATPGRQSWAWLDSGFRTMDLDLGRGEITFVRKATERRTAPAIPAERTIDCEAGKTAVTMMSIDKSELFGLPQGYDLALVSCVKTKLQRGAAKDIYISPRFQFSRRIAEARADRWLILSALYGLLAPETLIEYYDETLKGAPEALKRKWAERVFESICRTATANQSILILAGNDYCRHLVPLLEQRGHQVAVPLRGLDQGHGLSRLSTMARECP